MRRTASALVFVVLVAACAAYNRVRGFQEGVTATTRVNKAFAIRFFHVGADAVEQGKELEALDAIFLAFED